VPGMATSQREFFTSFLSRDEAYRLIMQCWSTAKWVDAGLPCDQHMMLHQVCGIQGAAPFKMAVQSGFRLECDGLFVAGSVSIVLATCPPGTKTTAHQCCMGAHLQARGPHRSEARYVPCAHPQP
jgi:hypothetical protein